MLFQSFYGAYLLGAPFETCMRMYMVWREKDVLSCANSEDSDQLHIRLPFLHIQLNL